MGNQGLCFVGNWWKHKRQGINKMEQEVKTMEVEPLITQTKKWL
jgi:hypothetical protein